jgi:hypothetical protein
MWEGERERERERKRRKIFSQTKTGPCQSKPHEEKYKKRNVNTTRRTAAPVAYIFSTARCVVERHSVIVISYPHGLYRTHTQRRKHPLESQRKEDARADSVVALGHSIKNGVTTENMCSSVSLSRFQEGATFLCGLFFSFLSCSALLIRLSFDYTSKTFLKSMRGV